MIKPAIVDLACAGGLEALLRVTRVAAESVASPAYHHVVGERKIGNGAIQITLSGCGHCWPAGGGTPIALPPGTALYFHAASTPGWEYGYRDPSGQPWSFLYADLTGATGAAIIGALAAERGPVAHLGPDHPLIAELRGWLPSEGHLLRTVPVGDALRLAHAVVEAVATAPGGPDDRGEDRHLTLAAMAYLRDHLAGAVEVAEVAAHLKVSREHLSRIFAAQTGEPPATWLRRQRLRVAAAALQRGDRPIAAIAADCGFATAAHFAALFRRHTGLTPRQYRRRGGVPGW